MKIGKTEKFINQTLDEKGAMIFTLIDPIDYKSEDAAVRTAKASVKGGADAVLIGGSTDVQGYLLDNVAKRIKEEADAPLILFPGNIATLTRYADAIYFMSLLNARNIYWVIQAQMLAANTIKRFEIEPLPVGYIIVQPGGTAGWVGDVNCVPRERPKIAAALAMAGQFLGNRIIVTDTGSNPSKQGYGPVPNEMIKAVKSCIDVPYIVAGGIRTTDQLHDIFSNGADIVQIGTAFEEADAYKVAKSFSSVAKQEGLKKLNKR